MQSLGRSGFHRDERRDLGVDVEMGRDRAHGLLHAPALRPTENVVGVEPTGDCPVGADASHAFPRIDENTIEVEEKGVSVHAYSLHRSVPGASG